MTTHVQDKSISGTNTSFTVPVTSAAGNTLICAATMWPAGNTPVNIVSVTDSTGGANTWLYSTAQQSQNPPAAGSYDAGKNGYGFTFVGCCVKAAPVTSVTVTISVSTFADVGVSEFSGIPAGSRVLAAASSNTLQSGVTAYTPPSLPGLNGTQLVFAATSFFGQFTGVSAGYTLLAYNDSIFAYSLAASGVPAFTAGAANDAPSSAILAIGARPSGLLVASFI